MVSCIAAGAKQVEGSSPLGDFFTFRNKCSASVPTLSPDPGVAGLSREDEVPSRLRPEQSDMKARGNLSEGKRKPGNSN